MRKRCQQCLCFEPVVDGIAAVLGRRWKVWIMNEAEKETGGIYLFDDEASINN